MKNIIFTSILMIFFACAKDNNGQSSNNNSNTNNSPSSSITIDGQSFTPSSISTGAGYLSQNNWSLENTVAPIWYLQSQNDVYMVTFTYSSASVTQQISIGVIGSAWNIGTYSLGNTGNNCGSEQCAIYLTGPNVNQFSNYSTWGGSNISYSGTYTITSLSNNQVSGNFNFKVTTGTSSACTGTTPTTAHTIIGSFSNVPSGSSPVL